MSTYLYLECLDHTPPLLADDESGQHLTDLPQIQRDIAARDALLALVAADVDGEIPYHLSSFRRATAQFLIAHPQCRIGIRDEYGREHPITEE